MHRTWHCVHFYFDEKRKGSSSVWVSAWKGLRSQDAGKWQLPSSSECTIAAQERHEECRRDWMSPVCLYVVILSLIKKTLSMSSWSFQISVSMDSYIFVLNSCQVYIYGSRILFQLLHYLLLVSVTLISTWDLPDRFQTTRAVQNTTILCFSSCPFFLSSHKGL